MVDLSDIKKQLDEAFPCKRDPNDPDVWVTARGEALKMSEMDDSHLINALLRIKRIAESKGAPWRLFLKSPRQEIKFKELEKEPERRGYPNWEKMRKNSVKSDNYVKKSGGKVYK